MGENGEKMGEKEIVKKEKAKKNLTWLEIHWNTTHDLNAHEFF